MADNNHLLCNADEFHVVTQRVPAHATAGGGTANTGAVSSNTVAFWFLVT